MSIALKADIEALGFQRSSFDDLAPDPATWTSFLQLILDEAALEVTTAVGSTLYDANKTASGTITFSRLKSAELYFTAQELAQRQINFEMRSHGEGDLANRVIERRKTREQYQEKCDAQLRSLGVSSLFDDDADITTFSTVNDSSHFAEDQVS